MSVVNYSHIIEGHLGWCRNPPWSNPPPAGCRKMPQDGISRKPRLAVAEKYFGGRLCWFGNIWKFIGQRLGLEELRGAHKPPGRPPRARSWRFLPPQDTLTLSPSPTGVFWSKKNHHKVLFRLESVWYSFSLKLKNKEKTETNSRL